MMPLPPPFLESMIYWAKVSGRHFLVMFWWIGLSAVVLTAASEVFGIERARRWLLERPADGWRTVWRAALLGVLSPPSRGRIFRQARALQARGVSPVGVVAYLVAAQSVLIWMLFFIVELNGPQPVLGQLVAVAVVLAVVGFGLRRIPEPLGASGGEAAGRADPEGRDEGPIARSGPVALRLLRSVGGQVLALWWPLLLGLAGLGFFLALGQSPASFSLQGSQGPLIQLGNAGAGLLLAYVTGAPLVGNAFVAAALWKAGFVTYAGLSAFYLGTLVMPFAWPRYLALFGPELGRRVLVWLVVAIVAGALAATAWWWGLDGLAGLVGVRDWFEALTHSTLRPNDVPWFHHWFVPTKMMPM